MGIDDDPGGSSRPAAKVPPDHVFSPDEMQVLWSVLKDQPGGSVVYNRIKDALDLLDVALERLGLYEQALRTISLGGSKSLATKALER